MNRIIFSLFLFFIVRFISFSQGFNVSEIDAKNYPNVSVNFTAFNGAGDYYKNLQSSDFSVNENGFNIPPNLINLYCTENLPTNVVLVLDRSSSMNELYNGETLWQWVIEGAITFINNFPFSDSAKIAVITFAGSSRLTCNFTNDKKELLDSINKIPDAYGPTNYNAALLDSEIGAIALLKTRTLQHRRAIIFMTDGMHESGELLRDKEISMKLIQNNIRFYGISLMIGLSKDLDLWAKQTAGKYSFISSKEALKNIYKVYAEDLKGTIQCQLEWLSPDICDISELYRRVKINFLINDDSVLRSYIAPMDRKVEVETDKTVYIFGDPPLNQSTDMNITITPRVSPIKVSNISIVPSEYFKIIDWGFGEGVKPTYDFTISMDKSIELKVRFTAKDIRKLRQAILFVDGTPCPLEVPLFGGYMQVSLDKPNAELFSRCDTIDIQWSGVFSNTYVDLLYSTNGGDKWNLIKDKVLGTSYKWFPNFNTSNLLIKVRISDQYTYDYINSLGGKGNEIATSIVATKNGNFHYISGYYNGETEIGGIKKVSNGKDDFFLAKFDIEGNPIWVKTGGSSSNDDRANGVTIDVRGNSYITGYTYQGLSIDGVQPPLDFPNSKYFFISKYSSSGQYFNSFFLGATLQYPDFQAEGIKIKTINKLGEPNTIAVIGKYTGSYYNSDIKATLPPATKETDFTAIFDEYLNLVNLYVGSPSNLGFSNLIYEDTNLGVKYEVGNFTGTTTIQGKQLNSKGLSDFWIYRYAKNPISEDISHKIEILRPEATFSQSVYDFGQIVYGYEDTQIAKSILCNSGKLPYTIINYSIKDIAGKDVPDFQLLTEIVGMTINPGDSIDLELWFKPGYLDLRQATLTINAECANNITLSLKGTGTCGGVSTEMHDFGDVNLNKQKYDTLQCVFKNLSQTATVISPQIRGTHWNDFYLILPDDVKAKEINGKITVKPNECINLIVRFEPKSLGLREAEINFFVQAPCKPSYTRLIGNGISSDIGVTSFDWSERRLNGIYNGEIEIINNSNAIETIDNIQFESGMSNGIFEFEDQTMPLNIPANGKVKIKVSFNPKQEITYAENILVFVESRDDPLISNLTGIGILPKLSISWDCGDKVEVGETTYGSITLTNPSKSSKLIINSISIENNDEFEFPAGTKLNNLTIDKEDFLTIPVLFTPISGGDNSDNFIIFADDYDGTFNEQWKKTIEPIVCDGLEVFYPTKIEFENNIVCTKRTLPITFENRSKDTDITLYFSKLEFSNEDAKHFELPNLNDQVLKGSQSFVFDISFSPQNKGHFSTVLTIPNSMGGVFKVSLEGEALGINLSANKNEVLLSVGQKFDFAIFADLPKTATGTINNLTIKFNSDPTVAGMVKNSFKTNLTNNWKWNNLEYLGNGYYQISGNGTLTDNQKVELFSLEYMTYLNDKQRTQIQSELDYGCMSDYYDLTIINTEEVCFNDNRIIEMKSNAKFGISLPNPNPANNIINLSYGIGFDTYTKIELINYTGETIQTIYDDYHKAGDYQLNIPTNNLSTGTYFIKMISGPYATIRQIMIIK